MRRGRTPTAHHWAAALGLGINQSDRDKIVEEPAAILGLDWADALEMPHPSRDYAAQRGRHSGSEDVDPVRLLDQKHPAWTQRHHHALERQRFVGEPLDQPSGMYQVEAGGKVLGSDVVSQYLEARMACSLRLEEFSLEVSGNDCAAGADLLSEPKSDGPTTGADLKAAPTGSGAEASQMVAGARVE